MDSYCALNQTRILNERGYLVASTNAIRLDKDSRSLPTGSKQTEAQIDPDDPRTLKNTPDDTTNAADVSNRE